MPATDDKRFRARILLGVLLGSGMLVAVVSVREHNVSPPEIEFVLSDEDREALRLTTVRGTGAGKPAISPSGDVTPANSISPENKSGARSLESYRAKVDEGVVDLHGEILQGAAEWTDTLLEWNDPLSIFEARDKCRNAFLPKGVCNYHIDAVLERIDDDMAVVAYSRLKPDLGMSNECAAYAACIAKAKLGAKVPLPPSFREPMLAHGQDYNDNRDGSLASEAALSNLIDILEADLAAARSMGTDGSLDWDYRVELQERLIEMYKLELEREIGA